jgi:TonB family protein
MNWQAVLSFSNSADWILLTAFHSLWLSFAAFLIMHLRKFKSPVVRSTWCTCTLILLLTLPLITWSVPRLAVRAQPVPKAAVETGAAIVEAQAPLLMNRLLDMNAPLPQAHIGRWKALMNQFGFLWLAVTLICVGRLLYQFVFLKGHFNGLQEIHDDRISAVLRECSHSFHFRKKPRFFASQTLTSPISTGIQTPMVIMPANLYQHIGDKELRAILLHEFAHIYHYDHVLGLLQRIIKALYWWNPFVYGICNSLSVAREEVSDNYAISGMDSAASYARLLVSLVEKTSLISRMPCTAGMGTPYELLESRIKSIVSKERDMHVKIGKRMMSLVLLPFIVLCVVAVIGSQVAVFGVGQASPSGQKTNEQQAASMPGESMKSDAQIVVSERLSKRLTYKVAPIYPEQAIKDRLQGKVTIQINVNEEGLVSDARIIAGHPFLNDAAITAVKQWKFNPTLVGGVSGGISGGVSGGVPGGVVGGLLAKPGTAVTPPPKPASGMDVPPSAKVPVTEIIMIDFGLIKDKSPKIVISGSEARRTAD